MKRFLAGWALAALLAVAVAAPGSAGTFTDTQGNAHEENIERLVDMGVAEGCDDDPPRYCPGHLIFRGQMATFLARALELPPASRDYFADDDRNMHEDNINRIAEAGITLGMSDGRFRAGGYVTRAQMATFLAKGFELPATDSDGFTDDEGNVHEDNINRVAAAGLATGCAVQGATARFCPDDHVTRAQMATFIVNAVDATEPEPEPSGSPSPTSSPSPSQ